MKVTEADIQEIMAIAEQAEVFKPVVQALVTKVQMFGPEIKDLLTGVAKGVADIRSAAIKQYKENGFTHEEAIVLACNDFDSTKHIESLQKLTTINHND